MTRTTFIRFLKIGLTVIIITSIIAYVIWRSFNYASGPHITLYEPINGSTILSHTVTVKGQVKHVTSLSLNGMSVSIDEAGNFEEVLIVFKGMNKITLSAKDQFGRSVKKELNLVGQ